MSNQLSSEQIEAQMKTILSHKFGVQESEINPNTNIVNDLGADSLDSVELVMELEKEFNIAIPDELAENCHTVEQLVTLVTNLLN